MAITRTTIYVTFALTLLYITKIHGEIEPGDVLLDKNTNTNPISDSELREASVPLLYPINFTHGELQHVNTAQTTITKSLGFRLPYFGFSYNYTIISTDGLIFFSDFMRSSSWPLKFPNAKWPLDNDPALIAPFFAYAAPSSVTEPNPSRPKKDENDQLQSGVYVRVVDLTKIVEGQTPDRESVILKKRLMNDFADGMPGAETFQAEYAIIISWVNMAIRSGLDPTLVNTFQLVIITNQKNSYAMFNYQKMNWFSHFDITQGQSGQAAFVGFNAGNGTMAHEFLPYSQNIIIKSLAQQGYGNEKMGRYYFNIDEEIFLGSCVDTTANPDMQSVVRITANPGNGNMLGGTMVNITGPCFDENTVISCNFFEKTVPGYRVSRNRATCIQPRINFYGYIWVSASVGGGSFTFSDDYYIEPPELATNTIEVDGGKDKEEKPATLTIKWQSQYLTTRPNTRLTLSLWGYREDDSEPHLTYISTLTEEGAINNDDGLYVISTDAFKNRKDGDLIEMTFGFLKLNITDPILIDLKESPYIWSKPMPLAWYFWPQWEDEAGDEGYKNEACDIWYEEEKQKNDFAFELPECPCTMQQAMADKGVFVPDQDCNNVDRKCDAFNQGALHCVRSGQPSMQGAGQQCCYDQRQELMHSNDRYTGGRPTRSFPYGQYPYTKREFVPTLSTWKYDVMPFLFCCKWNKDTDNSESCQKYKKRRTSQDCVGYRSPAIGSVFGDPHIVTFDGVSYTFNGRGEYTLMHIDNHWASMDIQGRFDQLAKDPYATFDSQRFPATTITGVAAQSNASEPVEIYLRPPASRWRYHLSVYVGGRYVFFNSDAYKMQSYKGVTVYVPEAVNNQSQVNVMFHNGAGIEVTEVFGHMSVRVFVPFVFMNGTSGLLGTYSKNTLDEFMLPDKRFAASTVSSNARDIYQNFGIEWLLSNANVPGKGSSIFSTGKVSSSFFEYTPEFNMPPNLILPKNSTLKMSEVLATCGDSVECQFDYILTKNKDLARSTKHSQTTILNLQSSSQTRVIRCPDLKTPLNGKKTTVYYTPGTTVRFVCNDGFRLTGHESRQCRDDGLWSWGETAECLTQIQYNLQVAGLVLGVMIPIILILIIIIICVVGKKRRKQRDENRRWDATDVHNEKGGENGPLQN